MQADAPPHAKSYHEAQTDPRQRSQLQRRVVRRGHCLTLLTSICDEDGSRDMILQGLVHNIHFHFQSLDALVQEGTDHPLNLANADWR